MNTESAGNAPAEPGLRGEVRLPIALSKPLRIALAAVAAVAAVLAFGFLGLPAIGKHVLTHQVSARLHRPIAVRSVEFNPLRLTLRVADFDMKDPDGVTSALAFDELFVDLDWSSLFRRAILIREARLVGPHVDIVRLQGDRYNVSDLLALFNDDKPSQAPPRFSVNNIQVQGGELRFDDRPQHARHSVSALRLAVPFISSLPYDVDIFVKPRFEARIDGRPVLLEGQTKPFKDSLETAVDLNVDGLPLPQYLAYLPALPMRVDSALLTSRLHVAFTRYDQRHPSLILSGRVELHDAALSIVGNADRNGRLFAAERIELPIVSLDVFERKATLGDIVVTAPAVSVARDGKGGLDIARVLSPGFAADAGKTAREQAAAPVPGAPEPALALELASLRIVEGRLAFSDALPSPPVDTRVTHLNATMGRFRLGAEDPAALTLAAALAEGETVSWKGSVRTAPLALEGDAALHGIHPERYAPYYDAALPYALTLSPVDLDAHLTVADGGRRVRVERGRVAAETLKVRERGASVDLAVALGARIENIEWDSGSPALKVGRASVRGLQGLGSMKLGNVGLRGATLDPTSGRIGLDALELEALQVGELARVARLEASTLALDTKAHRGSLQSLVTSGGHIALRRDEQGRFGLERAVVLPSSGRTAARTDAAPDAPWKFDLGRLGVTQYEVRFEDRALPNPSTLNASDIRLSALRLSTDKGARADTDLSLVLNRRGRIHAVGKTGVAPLAAAWKIEASNIDVAPFEGYFGPSLGIDVVSGTVSVAGKLAIGGGDDGGTLPLRFEGDAGIVDFLSKEKATGEEFLKWKSLAISGITANRHPLALDVRQVDLTEFYSRLVLYQTGRLNLDSILAASAPAPAAAAPRAAPGAPPTSAGPTKAPPAPATPAAVTAASGAPAPIKIDNIVVHGGRVDFSDFFIKPNYSAKLTDLAGTVTGMSSQPGGAADVDIRGRIDSAAPLRISGKLSPLQKDLTLDIRADVKDFELGPLTPYSGKYLGYAIDKGTLSFAVRYRIENRKLTAENQLVLNQLTFGNRVDSPVATKLPVLLAIALLKDRNGVIDVNLPIGGTLDDPQFSVGGLVWRALLNLLGKAVTAPFAALGAAFGQSGSDLNYIEFEPGRAALSPAARDKLATLAKALTERPSLRLDIAGEVAPEVDRDGLKREVLAQKLRARRAEIAPRGTSAKAAAADAAPTPEEIDALTKGVYRKETFAKPKNFLGLNKDLPRADMERLILDNIPAGDGEMRELARRRAEAVRTWLAEQGRVAAERMSILESPPGAKGNDSAARSRSRVAFGLH